MFHKKRGLEQTDMTPVGVDVRPIEALSGRCGSHLVSEALLWAGPLPRASGTGSERTCTPRCSPQPDELGSLAADLRRCGRRRSPFSHSFSVVLNGIGPTHVSVQREPTPDCRELGTPNECQNQARLRLTPDSGTSCPPPARRSPPDSLSRNRGLPDTN